MNEGKYVFAQIASYIPRFQFDKIVTKYRGNYHTRELTCYNQFLHLLFGQITPCNSLRDICLCLEAHKSILYHLGFGKTVDSTSLSRANERRDYRIYEEFGYYLIKLVRPYYHNTKLLDIDIENAIFALDSTTISTSIKLATWALGKYGKGAVKMHTLIDLRGSIPTQIHITDGRWHDSNMLDLLELDVNAIYTADKAYVDFPAMWTINLAGAYFVLRPKDNMRYVLVEQLSDGSRGTTICGDYIIRLTGYYVKHAYPADIRLVRALDPESGEVIDFITNNFEISALDVANIYRHRWDIEVFFKWIKQNIVVKTLWGYSENAVKTHLWSAICAYLLMALIKARTGSKYTITEVATLLSVSVFEKMDLEQLLTHPSDRLVSLLSNQNVKDQQLSLNF